MKWFSWLRGLVYLKRISEALTILAQIETERFIIEDPRRRDWAVKRIPINKPRLVEISKPTVNELNTNWRENNEIWASVKDNERE